MTSQALPHAFRWALAGSALVHVVAVSAVVLAVQRSGRSAAPPQRVLTTKLVRLGEPRPKELLPRKAVAPPAPEPKSVPAAEAKPKPKLEPKAKAKPKPAPRKANARDRVAEMKRVSSALQRLRATARTEGRPDGSPQGEVSDLSRAIIGNKFATEVEGCIKAHYSVEGVGASKVAGRTAEVWVRVAADGTFLESKIEKGSGLRLFDRAVQRAVKRCGKVSPPDAAIRNRVHRDGVVLVFTP